ncbi:hypothetical protein Tco_0554764 [Tanacetum coccineum]
MQSISNQIQIKDYRNEKIDIRYRRECEIMIDELMGKFNGMSIKINKKKELRKLEQAANLSTYTTEPSRCFNSFYDDDFDPKGDILLLEKLLNDYPSSPLPPKELYFAELKTIKSSIDTPPDFEGDYYDSEGDIIYLESLLIKDTIPNLHLEVFLDRDPRSLEDEPNKDDLKYIVKVFDPGVYEKIISPTYVRLSFEDRHYFSFTYVIRIFLPYFTYPVDSSLPFSSKSEDIIFDPGISAFSFYSLEPVDFLNFEDSRARSFVHRSLDLYSLACLLIGIRYHRSY